MENPSDSGPRRLAPSGITRLGALLLCSTLLGSAAVLIVAIKRGLFDLDGVATAVLSWVGLGLALSGFFYWIHIGWVDRFQFTIELLMAAVAIVAVILAYGLSFFPAK